MNGQEQQPAPLPLRRKHRANPEAKRRRAARTHGNVKRPRRVFGRRKVELDGRIYTIELQADGVHVVEKTHSYIVLGWPMVTMMARRQDELFEQVVAPAMATVLREALSAASPKESPKELRKEQHTKCEQCTKCGTMVYDWTDTNQGRICRQCDDKYGPDQRSQISSKPENHVNAAFNGAEGDKPISGTDGHKEQTP